MRLFLMKSKLKLIDFPSEYIPVRYRKRSITLFWLNLVSKEYIFHPSLPLKSRKVLYYIYICIYILFKGGEIVFQPTLTEAFYSQLRGSMSSEKPRGDYTCIVYIKQIYIIFWRVFLFTELSYTLNVFNFQKGPNFHLEIKKF